MSTVYHGLAGKRRMSPCLLGHPSFKFKKKKETDILPVMIISFCILFFSFVI